MSVLKIKDQNGNWIQIPTIKGEDGQDYVLTENDKQEIAGLVDAPVEDVQVDGASIVTDGVANIPIANASGTVPVGLVKPTSATGTAVASNGGLAIVQSNLSAIKTGANQYNPIVPQHQHESVFYGLAKIAGHDERESVLNVGTYSDEAKSAIQTMLGVPSADDVVTDVQINGTSIVSDGVAEIPIAGINTLGVQKVNGSYGIASSVNGTTLSINRANSSNIKNGSETYKPIVPINQHESVFYGLAKAAGADEKNSTLPVGQYTESAKTAIKKMIGVNDEFELIRCITLEEDSQTVIIDTDESSSPFSLQGFMIAIVSVAATDATAEGYLKIALNSTGHVMNRIFDIYAGIRKGSQYKNIVVIGIALNGIGHSVIQASQDSGGYIVDENGILNRSIYGNGTNNSVAFSNQQVINSVFVGTDNASLKLGVGSIIALYGIRV